MYPSALSVFPCPLSSARVCDPDYLPLPFPRQYRDPSVEMEAGEGQGGAAWHGRGRGALEEKG